MKLKPIDIKQEFYNQGMSLFRAAAEGKGIVSATIGLTPDQRQEIFEAFDTARSQAEKILSVVETLDNHKLAKRSW